MFGLRAKGGINKPSYYAYGLLHQLGGKRLANTSKDVIVTKTADGGLVDRRMESGGSRPARNRLKPLTSIFSIFGKCARDH